MSVLKCKVCTFTFRSRLTIVQDVFCLPAGKGLSRGCTLAWSKRDPALLSMRSGRSVAQSSAQERALNQAVLRRCEAQGCEIMSQHWASQGLAARLCGMQICGAWHMQQSLCAAGEHLNPRCEANGCVKSANFGNPGGRRVRCGPHRPDGMVSQAAARTAPQTATPQACAHHAVLVACSAALAVHR